MKQDALGSTGKSGQDPHPWVLEFPGAVTVCDKNGVIIDMNEEAARAYAGNGGFKLLGADILACHPDPAKVKLKDLMESRLKNIYTIKENGRRKLIFQTPWFLDGEYAGYLDLSLEIPWEMPHFDRDHISSVRGAR